jgi:hypothetical protein
MRRLNKKNQFVIIERIAHERGKVYVINSIDCFFKEIAKI